MVVVKLQGGLGNQMFQYATAFSLAHKNLASLYLDVGHYEKNLSTPEISKRNFELSCFDNVKNKIISVDVLNKFQPSVFKSIKKYLGLACPHIYIEKTFDFDPDLKTQSLPIYLNGYWQSYKYFNGVESEVRNLFRFPDYCMNSKLSDILSEIRNTNSLAIHIRRGDYLHPNNINFHGCSDLEYYIKAISFISNIRSNLFLYYFTDDPNWVRHNLLPLYPNSCLASDITGAESWHDMFLMSKCRYNIISNSTYSWWGAWLNSNQEKIVVAPVMWYRNSKANIESSSLLPKSWIRL